MQFRKLEKETVARANKYVPILKKSEFVDYAAQRSIDAIRVNVGEKNAEVSPYYKDNAERKARYLMGALLKLYLNIDYEPVEDDKWLMAADDYDRYAGGHVLNVLDRMKSDAELRDTVFDILYDYRELVKMFNTEVYNLVKAMNDPVTRAFDTLASGFTPEAMESAMNELKSLKGELESMAEKKEGGEDG